METGNKVYRIIMMTLAFFAYMTSNFETMVFILLLAILTQMPERGS